MNALQPPQTKQSTTSHTVPGAAFSRVNQGVPTPSNGPQGRLVRIAFNSSISPQNGQKSSRYGGLGRRIKMLDAACRLVHDKAIDDLPVAERLRAMERIEHCTRNLTYGAGAAELKLDHTAQTNTFANVQTCDSGACPYCSVHKAEEEKCRLQVGMAEAQRQGLYPLMITLTMRHKRGDALNELLDQLYAAKNSMFSGRFFQGMKERYGIVGHNRYTEVTVGPNGHHAHFHLLMFCRWEFSSDDAKMLQDELGPRWLRMLAKHGAVVPVGSEAARLLDEGVPLHVQPGDSEVVDYLAKMGRLPVREAWGVENELASAPAKRGHKDGFTPFELLALASGDPDARAEAFAAAFRVGADKVAWLAGKLWLEYYEAIKGRRMVDWGKGLLELFKVEEQVAELAEQEKEKANVESVLKLIDYGQLRSNTALYLAVREAGNDLRAIRALLDGAGLHYEMVKREGKDEACST